MQWTLGLRVPFQCLDAPFISKPGLAFPREGVHSATAQQPSQRSGHLIPNGGSTFCYSAAAFSTSLLDPCGRADMAHTDTSALGPEENGNNSERASETPFIPQRPSLTPAQEQKLLEKVKAIDSTVPLYVVILSRSNACRGLLKFGTIYASRYLNKHSAAGKKSVISLVLQLEGESRTWDTELQCKTNRTTIVKGWASFADGNRLREGNFCLFKLMESEEPLKMMVYIIRRGNCT